MIINNSLKSPYFSQRNNKITPWAACNVTAMVDALCAAGWKLPGPFGDEQWEDALLTFIRCNAECAALWKRLDPSGQFPPNQWHAVLALGANLWVDARAVQFKTDAVAAEILNHLIDGGTCVQSGSFPKTSGHVVAVVGVDYVDVDDPLINGFIIDDPWGDYKTGYASQKGNDVFMPMKDWLAIMRAEGKPEKLCHFVRRAP